MRINKSKYEWKWECGNCNHVVTIRSYMSPTECPKCKRKQGSWSGHTDGVLKNK